VKAIRKVGPPDLSVRGHDQVVTALFTLRGALGGAEQSVAKLHGRGKPIKKEHGWSGRK
jgi:hypothetical protein